MEYRFLVVSNSGSDMVLTSYNAKPFNMATTKMPVEFQKTLEGITYNASSQYAILEIPSVYNQASWPLPNYYSYYSSFLYAIKEETASSFMIYMLNLEEGSCKLAATYPKGPYDSVGLLGGYFEDISDSYYGPGVMTLNNGGAADEYPVLANPSYMGTVTGNRVLRADAFQPLDTYVNSSYGMNVYARNGDSLMSLIQYTYKGTFNYTNYQNQYGYFPSSYFNTSPLIGPYYTPSLFTTNHAPWYTVTSGWGSMDMIDYVANGGISPWDGSAMPTNKFNATDGGAVPDIAATGQTPNPSFFFTFLDRFENIQAGFFEQKSTTLLDTWKTSNAMSAFTTIHHPAYYGEGYVPAYDSYNVTSSFNFYPSVRNYTVSFGDITHPAFANVSNTAQLNIFGKDLLFWEATPVLLSDIVADSSVYSNAVALLCSSSTITYKWENKKQVEETNKGI